MTNVSCQLSLRVACFFITNSRDIREMQKRFSRGAQLRARVYGRWKNPLSCATATVRPKSRRKRAHVGGCDFLRGELRRRRGCARGPRARYTTINVTTDVKSCRTFGAHAFPFVSDGKNRAAPGGRTLPAEVGESFRPVVYSARPATIIE